MFYKWIDSNPNDKTPNGFSLKDWCAIMRFGLSGSTTLEWVLRDTVGASCCRNIVNMQVMENYHPIIQQFCGYDELNKHHQKFKWNDFNVRRPPSRAWAPLPPNLISISVYIPPCQQQQQPTTLSQWNYEIIKCNKMVIMFIPHAPSICLRFGAAIIPVKFKQNDAKSEHPNLCGWNVYREVVGRSAYTAQYHLRHTTGCAILLSWIVKII